MIFSCCLRCHVQLFCLIMVDLYQIPIKLKCILGSILHKNIPSGLRSDLYKAAGIRGKWVLISTFQEVVTDEKIFFSMKFGKTSEGSNNVWRKEWCSMIIFEWWKNILGDVLTFFSLYNSMFNYFFKGLTIGTWDWFK